MSETLNTVALALGAAFWMALLIHLFGGFDWRVPAATLFAAVCVLTALSLLLPTPQEVYDRRRETLVSCLVEHRRLEARLGCARTEEALFLSDSLLPGLPAALQQEVDRRLTGARSQIALLELQVDYAERAVKVARQKCSTSHTEMLEIAAQRDTARSGFVLRRAFFC